jgi:PAS domain S-box-containing protein
MPVPSIPPESRALRLFERGPVVVFVWRNTPGWPVDEVSGNAAEVFGYEPAQFLSGEIAYVATVHADDAARVAAEVQQALNDGATHFVHAPYRIRRADGAVRWLHDVTHVVHEGGVATHFAGYVVDITERVSAEQERLHLERKLQQTQRLESLGLLAGGVAHDFNNLLTGILGHAELAELDRLPEQVRLGRSLAHIQALAERAADLTRQLLAYSGRGPFKVEAVDCAAVVLDLVDALGAMASKKATLTLAIEPVPAVMADRGQLQQIVLNLITNASEALSDREGRIEISTRADGGDVVLSVTDDGAGMSDEVRSQLFDPFFSTKAPGRGLGLSAVHGIVRAHRGSIDVRSAPGEGATFTVRLPATDAVPEPPRLPRAARPGRGAVLVVDDDIDIRHVACRALERAGYRAIAAVDGQDAVDRITADPRGVQAVLLDLTMPRLGGLEAMEQIRAIEPSMPIIVSSGYTLAGPLSEGAHDPRTRLLQKPYPPRELIVTLGELLAAIDERRVTPDAAPLSRR